MGLLLDELKASVIAFDNDKVEELTRQGLDQGISVKKILYDGLIAALETVGERFERQEMFIPEMLRAAEAMQKGLNIIRPLFEESNIETLGTVVIGTVEGDLHDIGKSMVGMTLESSGFKVVDLGVSVSPEKFVKSAKDEDAKLVGMSALLSTTMGAMQTTIHAIRSAGLNVKTLIGGAPITQQYADSIGADGFAPDMFLAVKKTKELLHVS